MFGATFRTSENHDELSLDQIFKYFSLEQEGSEGKDLAESPTSVK